jgi:hypothetical protein
MIVNRKFILLVILISCSSFFTCSASIAVASNDVPNPIPTPLPTGWSEYSLSGFHIALPDHWTNILQKFNTPWSRYITSTLTTEEAQELLKFWAMDTQPTRVAYATISVLAQTLPITIKSSQLCCQFPSSYKQMGITLIDRHCGIEINGLDAAWFQVQKNKHDFTVNEYQFIFIKEQNIWAMTMSVDPASWEKFKPTFETIAESFWITQ